MVEEEDDHTDGGAAHWCDQTQEECGDEEVQESLMDQDDVAEDSCDDSDDEAGDCLWISEYQQHQSHSSSDDEVSCRDDMLHDVVDDDDDDRKETSLDAGVTGDDGDQGRAELHW